MSDGRGIPRGEEAVRHVEYNVPDIILMDINLKGAGFSYKKFQVQRTVIFVEKLPKNTS